MRLRRAVVSDTVAANSASGGSGGVAGGGNPGGLPGKPGTDGMASGGVGFTGSTPRLTNTILAGDGGGNCSAAPIDGGHNLEFNPTDTCAFAVNAQHGDPLLGALANNGGPTQTMAPGPGSGALDTGDPAACAASPVNGKDQRGYARRSDRCSIGAYEGDPATPNPLPPPAPSGPPASGVSPLPNPRPSGGGGGAPSPLPPPRP